jgi:hypothetical protein
MKALIGALEVIVLLISSQSAFAISAFESGFQHRGTDGYGIFYSQVKASSFIQGSL